MYILGINAYHADASACIYHNDVLIAASEEERFRRIKHWAGFPTAAISFCLKEAGITIQEVDYIAISRDPKANFLKKVFTAFKNRLSFANIINRAKNIKKAANLWIGHMTTIIAKTDNHKKPASIRDQSGWCMRK
jgi:carbamoyltransferase